MYDERITSQNEGMQKGDFLAKVCQERLVAHSPISAQ